MEPGPAFYARVGEVPAGQTGAGLPSDRLVSGNEAQTHRMEFVSGDIQ